MDTNIFSLIALSQIPRILGFGDRLTASKTYGCFDRSFWHYKTIDFVNARCQEAALTCALVYKNQFLNNSFYDNLIMKEWSLAAARFWLKARNSDGSCNESYPHEHHFCATALSLYSITECMLLLEKNAPREICPTGDFLAKHDNNHTANQMAGAAAALFNLYLLTNQGSFRIAFEKKLNLLLSMQSEKGFFNEYGGFDLGYDSITVSIIASLYKKTKKDSLKNAALRCIQHMKPFILEDGSYNYESMSRKTQFLYPFGFAVFDQSILEKISHGLKENSILNPQWMDDRYCIAFANDYLLCAAHLQEAGQ